MATIKKSTGEDMKKPEPSYSAAWMENGAATLENKSDSSSNALNKTSPVAQWIRICLPMDI